MKIFIEVVEQNSERLVEPKGSHYLCVPRSRPSDQDLVIADVLVFVKLAFVLGGQTSEIKKEPQDGNKEF